MPSSVSASANESAPSACSITAPSRSAVASAVASSGADRRGAEGEREQHAAARRAPQQVRDELQRGVVGPVQVVERRARRLRAARAPRAGRGPRGGCGSARPAGRRARGRRRAAPRRARAAGRRRAAPAGRRRGTPRARPARPPRRRTAARARARTRGRSAPGAGASARAPSSSSSRVLPIPPSPREGQHGALAALQPLQRGVDGRELSAPTEQRSVGGGQLAPIYPAGGIRFGRSCEYSPDTSSQPPPKARHEMHMKTLAALAATTALALGATACGGSDDDTSTTPGPTADRSRQAGRRDPGADRQGHGGHARRRLRRGARHRSSSPPRRSARAEISKAGVASFPITGGNVTYYTPGTESPYVQGMIDHDGSGLSLTGGGKTVELTDFEVDPGKSVLTGKVTVDGTGRRRVRAAVLPRRPHAEAAGDRRQRHRDPRGHDRQAQAGGRGPAQSDLRRRRAEGRLRDRRRQDHGQHRLDSAGQAARAVGARAPARSVRSRASRQEPAGRSRAAKVNGSTHAIARQEALREALVQLQRVEHRHVPQVDAEGERPERAQRRAGEQRGRAARRCAR